MGQAKLSRPTGTWETPQHNNHSQACFHHVHLCSKNNFNNQASTSRIQQSNTSTNSETLATIASIQKRTKAKNRPKKPSRTSSTPMTESDKLLSANTYIGPVKKKGRPKGGSAVKIKQEELSPFSSQESTAPPPSQVSSFCIGTSTTTTTIQSTTNTGQSHPQPSDQNAPSTTGGLDLAALAALFSANQSETAQNAFLLNTLNLIDSAGSQSGPQTPPNVALIEALGQLLKNAYVATQLQPIPTAAAEPSSTRPSAQFTQTALSKEEDIVLLDKENVNPSVFKRCAEREYEQMKLVGNNTRASNPNSQSAVNPQTERQNRGFGARSIENTPPKIQPTVSGSLSTTSMLRKRTLDDCMEERDNKRNRSHRSKGKERERGDRHSSHFLLSKQQNHVNGLRHYPRILASTLPRPENQTNYYRTGIDAWTSPPRPTKKKSIDLPLPLQPSSPLGGTSPNRPIVIPDSPQALRVSASSPIKPTNRDKKTYVVPSWARTDTATQPRLSEDAQRAAEAAAEKKREERRANRRKTNAAAQVRSRQRRMVNSENINAPDSEPEGPLTSMRPPPQPESDLLPIIASSDACPIFLPPSDQRLRSPSPTPRSHLPPPITPKQLSKVASSTPGTAEYDGDSLFTPLSIARRSTGTGSPLSPGIFGSPLARRGFRVTSQTSYRSVGKHLGSESSNTTVKALGTSEDSPTKSKSPMREDPDEALDDLECPPSSLPIASSDSEIDDTTTQNAADPNEAEENPDDEDLSPRKQHWVGLPPSSPPPPTSPGLMPVDDDFDIPGGNIDDGDLPIASETDEPEDEPQEHALSNTPESDWVFDPANDSEISMPDNSSGDFNIDQETVDDLAFFEQFTRIGSSDGLLDIPDNHQGDPGSVGGDLDSLFPGGFDNMDLNGFLETFRPLIHQDCSVPGTAEPDPIFDFCTLDGGKDVDPLPQSLDHTKLAEDLQALLGGCLV